HLANFLEVLLQRTIGDQLDVVKPGDLLAVIVDRAITRRHIHNGIVRERLPNGAAPSGLKGIADLIARVGGRTAGQPEGIRRFDSLAVGGKIRSLPSATAFRGNVLVDGARRKSSLLHGVYVFLTLVGTIAPGAEPRPRGGKCVAT